MLHQSKAQRSPQGRSAFSLVELLTVVALITMLGGVATTAMKGVGRSGTMNTGARALAGLLNVARSEAIARHTITRFAVAVPQDGDEGKGLRRASVWAWDHDTEMFVPITQWEELPVGLALEPQLPDYLREAQYAKEDGTITRGDCVLADEFSEKAEYTFSNSREDVIARYVEFLPTGGLRIPGSSARQAVFVATEAYLRPNSDAVLTYTSPAGNRPSNWAQINVNALTGRVRVYQP